MVDFWRKDKSSPEARAVPVDATELGLDCPTIVYLCGMFATEKTPHLITGAAKRLEEFIEGVPEAAEANILIWPHRSGLRHVFDVVAASIQPHRMTTAQDWELAQKLIVPLAINNPAFSRTGLVSGQPVAEEIVRARFRRLTVVGFSAGSVTGQGLYNASYILMRQAGHSPAATQRLLREIAFVSLGHVTTPALEESRFATLYLSAYNDIVCRLHRLIVQPVRSLWYQITHWGGVRHQSTNSLWLSAQMPYRNRETRQYKGRKWVQKVRPLVSKYLPLPLQHELSRYLSTDHKLSPFTRILRHTFAKAIGRDRPLLHADFIPSAEIRQQRQP